MKPPHRPLQPPSRPVRGARILFASIPIATALAVFIGSFA
jgi:hypothetical protein